MIGLNEDFEKSVEKSRSGFSVLALMRSLDAQLAAATAVPSPGAQDLVYDAWEAPTDKREFELLQEALRIDPGNIDALWGVLNHQPVPIADEIEILRNVVALAAKRLGPDAFERLAGAFWGVHETRPYMRVRERLAETLRLAGRIEEAIAEWEGMLKLNPNDNQGMRYKLLASYLTLNRLDAAARLFERYDECGLSIVFSWGRVLERFVREDLAGAASALEAARKQNPYLERYLLARTRLPKRLPERYTMGSNEEALCFADVLRMAWDAHPKARKWLQQSK